MSLYRRHILSIISVCFVVSGFFSWLSYEVTQGYINEAKKERVALLAEIVKNGLKSIMLEGRNREDFQRFLDGLAAEDIRSVRVFSERALSSTQPCREKSEVRSMSSMCGYSRHSGNPQ